MVFSSNVFLFLFLPITLILYYAAPERFRNGVLLCMSLIFYAWGEPKYVLVMLGSILINYLSGIRIHNLHLKRDSLTVALNNVDNLTQEGDNSNPDSPENEPVPEDIAEAMKVKYARRIKKVTRQLKFSLFLNVFINLLLLGVFKYAGFIVELINSTYITYIEFVQLALPIGISFYTFQCLSYTVDVYRRKVPVNTSIIDFATYVCMFPQLIAGPIIRYKDVRKSLKKRSVNMEMISDGVILFVRGLAKKVILADQVGLLFEEVKALDELTTLSAWLGAIAFMLQIYFDFSGYSDMAIGLGKFFGFNFKKNFDQPYASKTITEFWRRWHISLSGWFREYVYIPLGGNRKGKTRQIVNIVIVWILTGIWHGAGVNFLLWGVYYAVILMLEKVFLERLMLRTRFFNHVYTLFVVCFGWVIFAFTDMTRLGIYISSMFYTNCYLYDENALFLLSNYWMIVVLAIIFCVDYNTIVNYIKEKRSNDMPGLIEVSEYENKGNVGLAQALFTAFLLILSVAFMVGNTYSPFLYFRF